MQHKRDKTPRRTYEKPKLRTIELAADEILAVGCKTSPVNPGKLGGGCTNPICSNTTGS